MAALHKVLVIVSETSTKGGILQVQWVAKMTLHMACEC